jgi:hypothetical protein
MHLLDGLRSSDKHRALWNHSHSRNAPYCHAVLLHSHQTAANPRNFDTNTGAELPICPSFWEPHYSE